MVLCTSSMADDTAPTPATPPAVQGQPAAADTTTAAKPASKPTAQKPSAKAKPLAKAKQSSRIDLEVAGMTSETTDQVYSRFSLNRRNGPAQWFLRSGYSVTRTKTYSKDKVNTTELDTTTLDAQYRRDRRQTYNFVSAAANIRNRSPYSRAYGELTGYYLMSAGVGRKLITGLEGELALAAIHRYDDGGLTEYRPTYTLRLRSPITSSIMLDGESNFVEPFGDNTIVDSRLNLTYKFTEALSMRLTYIANNLLVPITNRTGWDKSFRVSLVFSRATQ